MVPITERPRPGRRARERQLEKRGKAPLCRVGRSDEPAQSRWNRCTSDASGFLLQRHAHHTASRFSYGETLAQTSLRTITRKAGNSNSVKDFTAFQRERVNVMRAVSAPSARRRVRPGVGQSQRQIEHALEFGGTARDLIVLPPLVVEDAKILVGDIERREDGEFQRIAGGGFAEGGGHLRRDLGRPPRRVRR